MLFKLATSLLVAATVTTTPYLASAQNPGDGFPENLNGCLDSVDPDVDYFPSKYERPSITSYGDVDIFGDKFEPHNTTDYLEITYHNTYKIVTNKFQDVSYLLYQCGTEPPQQVIDEGDFHLVLEVPHKGGVAITSTVQIPPLELLGLRTEIIAYLGDPQYISSPCLLHLLDVTGDVESVYGGYWNTTLQAELDAEWIGNNPDAIILGGPFGNAAADRTVSIAASQERTNVATFDWIAMYAALFNLEGLANKIRTETQAQYECSADNARFIAAQSRRKLLEQEEKAAEKEAEKDRQLRALFEKQQRQLEADQPVLLWANWIEGYNWSVAECPTWDSTYYCEYAAHCDVHIISRPQGLGWNDPSFGGAFWYLNDEEMLELGKDADVWIYSSQFWDNMYPKKKDIVDQFKSVQNQQVYDTQGMGTNAWFEQRLAEYDIVGLDLCDIAGRSNPNGPPHQRRWLRNIFTEDVGSLEECNIPDELSEPYIPGGADCVPLTLDVPSVDDGSEDGVGVDDGDDGDDTEPSESGEDGAGDNDDEDDGESGSSNNISSPTLLSIAVVAWLSSALAL